MKKYILSLVLVIGLFATFGKVFAGVEVDACMDERRKIENAGFTPFLPKDTKPPTISEIQKKVWLSKYGTTNYSYKHKTTTTSQKPASAKANTGINSAIFTLLDGSTGDSGLVYTIGKTELNQTQWNSLQQEINNVYQAELENYQKPAKEKLAQALSAKLKDCKKIEDRETEKKVRVLEEVDEVKEENESLRKKIDVVQERKSDSDQTADSLKRKISELESLNVSLSRQVNVLQAQLLASQNENSTLKNSFQFQKEKPVIKVTPTAKSEPVVSDTPMVTTPVVETPAPAKKGVWQRLTGWLK